MENNERYDISDVNASINLFNDHANNVKESLTFNDSINEIGDAQYEQQVDADINEALKVLEDATKSNMENADTEKLIEIINSHSDVLNSAKYKKVDKQVKNTKKAVVSKTLKTIAILIIAGIIAITYAKIKKFEKKRQEAFEDHMSGYEEYYEEVKEAANELGLNPDAADVYDAYTKSLGNGGR